MEWFQYFTEFFFFPPRVSMDFYFLSLYMKE